MATEAGRARISLETPSRVLPRDGEAANPLIRAHVWVSVLAFGTLLLSIGIDLPIQLYNRLR